VAAARSEQSANRAGLEADLATVQNQLATKEAIVDRYLADYEDNKIDKDVVARRVDKIAEQMRQLRQRRDELAFTLDRETDEPDDTYLTGVRDHVKEVIRSGSIQERKALCEALISEIHVTGDSQANLVLHVPLSATDAATILGVHAPTANQTTVRACPPPVRRQGLEPRTRGLKLIRGVCGHRIAPPGRPGPPAP
jgi:site-specific DNA recombinase